MKNPLICDLDDAGYMPTVDVMAEVKPFISREQLRAEADFMGGDCEPVTLAANIEIAAREFLHTKLFS